MLVVQVAVESSFVNSRRKASLLGDGRASRIVREELDLALSLLKHELGL